MNFLDTRLRIRVFSTVFPLCRYLLSWASRLIGAAAIFAAVPVAACAGAFERPPFVDLARVAPPALKTFGNLKLIATDQLNENRAVAELAEKTHLWGIGMPRGLDHEVLVMDGVIHTSTAKDGDAPTMRTPNDLPVAFLAYANVAKWERIPIPADVVSFDALRAFIRERLVERKKDLSADPGTVVRLVAEVDQMRFFIVGGMGNLMPNPLESFQQQRRIGELKAVHIEAAGVYTESMQGEITAPGEALHLHFITRNAAGLVGHLHNQISLRPGAILLLPLREDILQTAGGGPSASAH